ncbi:hypothetical protein DPMN_091411 [Dreissena polymorpha]|uniref:Uncharacterized protein n=1 Tax=Dreissena polymorpha TaxID=45954 RepID=A0A9D4L216_DREPO|nr:hypothetical protein DPMN_091411 [Dreissena polymorpha]
MLIFIFYTQSNHIHVLTRLSPVPKAILEIVTVLEVYRSPPVTPQSRAPSPKRPCSTKTASCPAASVCANFAGNLVSTPRRGRSSATSVARDMRKQILKEHVLKCTVECD